MPGLSKKLWPTNNQKLKIIKNHNNNCLLSKRKTLHSVISVSSVFLFILSTAYTAVFNHSSAAALKEELNQIRITANVPENEILDSDNDGIPNIWEIYYGLDPNDPSDAFLDPDQDGLNNLKEYNFNTNPFLFDSDQDGTEDLKEITQGTNPFRDYTNYQEGKDLIPFWWLKLYGLKETNPVLDPDQDGLNNYQEYIYGTNPSITDTDKDKIPDGLEIYFHTNPNQKDTDWDNVGDFEELFVYKTNPTNDDSDQDLSSDGEEILNNTDPLNSYSTPPTFTPIISNNNINLYKKTYKYIVITPNLNLNISFQETTNFTIQGNNINNKEITFKKSNKYFTHIVNILDTKNNVIFKKYLNFVVVEPMQIYKYHTKFLLLGTNGIYLNNSKYNKMQQTLNLNKITILNNLSVKIDQTIYTTNNEGKTTVSAINPNTQVQININNSKYNFIKMNNNYPLLTEIIKLDRIFNLNLLLLAIIILLTIFIIIKRRRKNHHLS